MDGDAAAACHEADDGVTRYRGAAFGEMHLQSHFPADKDAGGGARFQAAHLEVLQILCGLLKYGLLESKLFLVSFRELNHRALHGDTAEADSGKKVIGGRTVEGFRDFEQAVFPDELLPFIAETVCFLEQELLAACYIFFSVFFLEPAADLRLAVSRTDHIDPVIARLAIFGSDDGNDIPVLQLRIERDDLIIHLRPNAAVADFGMDAVCKVDRDRALWQVDDIALRCEDENFIREDIELQRIHEFLRVAGILPFQDTAQPRDLRIEVLAAGMLAFLVAPVSSDTVFRNVMHFPRADLDLYRLPLCPDDGRMERLVHIWLRDGDVVLEAVRKRSPERVCDAEDRIALRDGIYDDTHCIEVIDLG